MSTITSEVLEFSSDSKLKPLEVDQFGLGILPKAHQQAIRDIKHKYPPLVTSLDNALAEGRSVITDERWVGPKEGYQSFLKWREPWTSMLSEGVTTFLSQSGINFEGAEVIDLGCGLGGLTSLIDFSKVKSLVGVDKNTHVTETQLPIYNVIQTLDIEQGKFEGEQVDFVVALSAMDTIHDYTKAAECISEMLKPGGMAVFLQDFLPDPIPILNQYLNAGMVFPSYDDDSVNYYVLPYSKMEKFMKIAMQTIDSDTNLSGEQKACYLEVFFQYFQDPYLYHNVVNYFEDDPDHHLQRFKDDAHADFPILMHNVLEEFNRITNSPGAKPVKLKRIDPQQNWMDRTEAALNEQGIKILRRDRFEASSLIDRELVLELFNREKANEEDNTIVFDTGNTYLSHTDNLPVGKVKRVAKGYGLVMVKAS